MEILTKGEYIYGTEKYKLSTSANTSSSITG